MIVVGDVLQTPSPGRAAAPRAASPSPSTATGSSPPSAGPPLPRRGRPRRRRAGPPGSSCCPGSSTCTSTPRSGRSSARASTCRSSGGCSSTRSRSRPATPTPCSPRRCGRTSCRRLLRHGTTTAAYFARQRRGVDRGARRRVPRPWPAGVRRSRRHGPPDGHARVVPGRLGVGRRGCLGPLDRRRSAGSTAAAPSSARSSRPASRRLHDAGVPIGLGTDVAGGASPGLLAQCQRVVTMSGSFATGSTPAASAQRGTAEQALDVVTAFWLATAGGADAAGLPVGVSRAAGYCFDAVVVETPWR